MKRDRQTKIAKNAVKHHVGDTVVIRTTSWEGVSRLRVALVTNINPAGKMVSKSYDVRTEDGSGIIMIGVDDPKSTQTIMSGLTAGYNNSGASNNMHIHKKHGHTRANYSKSVGKLRYDGEGNGSSLMGHYEKYNNFVFPTQGPRSF